MIISLSSTGGTPAEQVHAQIRGLIMTGALAAGERLPPVRQLARDLGVAVGTIAKAYRQLEDEGLVDTRIGSGTRVSATASAIPRRIAQEARGLVAHAKERGVALDDLLQVVRASWQ